MCGITGLFDTRGKRPVDDVILRRMNASQAHRGPDAGSLHIEPGVGLGHRRLSIIDVATGHQPLFNEDGSVAIVFNVNSCRCAMEVSRTAAGAAGAAA